jgi:hypothetical protein
MAHTGRCYCGEIHYEFSDDAIKSQMLCVCRECRYLSGGGINTSIVIKEDSFKFTKGTPKTFQRSDLETPRVRWFCGNCGTHICVKSPPRPGMLVLKIGTLDDHSWFKPESVIFCIDKQEYHQHQIPEGIPTYERLP